MVEIITLTRVHHGSTIVLTLIWDPLEVDLTRTGSRSMHPMVMQVTGGLDLRTLAMALVSVSFIPMVTSATLMPSIATEWPQLALLRSNAS